MCKGIQWLNKASRSKKIGITQYYILGALLDFGSLKFFFYASFGSCPFFYVLNCQFNGGMNAKKVFWSGNQLWHALFRLIFTCRFTVSSAPAAVSRSFKTKLQFHVPVFSSDHDRVLLVSNCHPLRVSVTNLLLSKTLSWTEFLSFNEKIWPSHLSSPHTFLR